MGYGFNMATGGFAGVRIGENVPQPNRGSPLRNVYDAAATTQAEDYDNIMRGYDDILSTSRNRQNQGLNYVPINPVFSQQFKPTEYSRSGDLDTAISGLKGVANTGGYSDSDVQNIRERSISPIRSIYSSAQEGLRRNKVLQGGYSPNYGAVSAKMARDASSQIGDITTKVNADIAQMIASGRMAGLNSLASTTGRENELINTNNVRNNEMMVETDLNNTNEQRRVNTLNSTGRMNANNESVNDQMGALQGRTSLYGTTPALTNTFANQVLSNNQQNIQAATTANTIKNQRANIGLNLVQNQLGIPRVGRG
jgi:hypothetical protein